jgi:hypothetical protein
MREAAARPVSPARTARARSILSRMTPAEADVWLRMGEMLLEGVHPRIAERRTLVAWDRLARGAAA